MARSDIQEQIFETAQLLEEMASRYYLASSKLFNLAHVKDLGDDELRYWHEVKTTLDDIAETFSKKIQGMAKNPFEDEE